MGEQRSRRGILAGFVPGALLALCACVALAEAVPSAPMIAGETAFAREMESSGQLLTARGAGIRHFLFLDVYAIALYAPSSLAGGEDLLGRHEPIHLEIVALRDLGAKRFIDALEDGLRDNHTDEQFRQLESARAAFAEALTKEGEVRKGTHIALYRNGAGNTVLRIDGTQRLDLDAPGFFDALLRIWIGKSPVDESLKDRLLGRPKP